MPSLSRQWGTLSVGAALRTPHTSHTSLNGYPLGQRSSPSGAARYTEQSTSKSDEAPIPGTSDAPEHLPSGEWLGVSGEWQQSGSNDRYREQTLLGEGGMGRVMVASDVLLRREVAVKKALGAPDGPEAQRLLREARITAALDHPGIVPVFDVGEDDEGHPFYVMRYVRGRSLSDAIAEAGTLDGRLLLIRGFLAAVEAVAFAHRAGIVHRDIKPDNILVGPLGETQVMDWGLARALNDEDWGGVLTQDFKTRTGAVLGTPAYMSPEQASGEELGLTVDVWALGAVLYELLSGQRPFKGPSQREMIAQILSGSRPALRMVEPEVDPVLVSIVRRALERDPKDRYPDAGAMAEALDAWLNGRRVPGARRPSVGLLAAGGLAALMLGAGWFWGSSSVKEADAPATVVVQDAWVAQARIASDDGQRMEAERLAAKALALGDHPGARGVLARHGLEPLPVLLGSVHLDDCGVATLAAQADLITCATANSLNAYNIDGTVRWQLPGQMRRVRVDFAGVTVAAQLAVEKQWTEVSGLTGEAQGHTNRDTLVGRGIMLRFPRAGASRVPGHFISLNNGRSPWFEFDDYTSLRPQAKISACGDHGGLEWVMELELDQFLIACADRSLVRKEGADGEERLAIPSDAVDSIVWTGAIDPTGRWLALGGVEGDLQIIDLANDARLATVQLGPRMIRGVSVSSDGTLVATRDSEGVGWIIPVAEPAARFRIPGDVRRLQFRGMTAVALRGSSLERWEVPAPRGKLVHRTFSGVVDMKWGEQGLLASAQEVLWTDHDGAVQRRVTLDELAAASLVDKGLPKLRSVGWTRDGKVLATGFELGLLKIDRESIRPMTDRAVTEVVPLASGSIVTFSNSDSNPVLWTPEGERIPNSWVPGWSPSAGQASTDGTFAVLLGRQGNVLLVKDGTPPTITRLPTNDAADALLVTNDGTTLYRVGPGGVTVRPVEAAPSDGKPLFVSKRTGPIALSPDERYMLVGYHGGVIQVRDRMTGALLVEGVGHTRRVSTMAVSPDGARMATGSWDRTVRLWDFSVVDADVEALIAGVEARWGFLP